MVTDTLTWDRVLKLERELKAKMGADYARPSTDLTSIAIHTTTLLPAELQPYPRSPARAKRRAKLGHPQHHRLVPSRKIFFVNGSYLCHPARLAQLKAEIERVRDGVLARAVGVIKHIGPTR